MTNDSRPVMMATYVAVLKNAGVRCDVHARNLGNPDPASKL